MLDAVPPAGAFVRLHRRSDDGTVRSAEQVEVLERTRAGAHYSLAPAYRRSEEVFEVRGVGGDPSEMRLLFREDELAPGEDGQGRGWGTCRCEAPLNVSHCGPNSLGNCQVLIRHLLLHHC